MWARAADHARKKVWFSMCAERRGKGQISALQKMSPPGAFNTAPEAQFVVGLPIPPSRLRRATVPQFNMVASLRAQSALAMFPVSLGTSYRPALRWPGIPGLRSASRCSSIQHGRPTPSHRPALTLARCSAPADFASLRVLGAPAASRPPTLAGLACDTPCLTGLTSACFRHRRRPSCAPFPFGKKEAFGQCYSLRRTTNQKAPFSQKGSCRR